MRTRHETGRVPIVEVIVTDAVDMETASRLFIRLDEALQLRPVQLVVDLAACPHIDAAGIGMLLQVHRQAHQGDAQLILRSPSPRLRRNLALARVDHVLHVAPREAGPDASPHG
ncbi:MAG TPA: STAS domain-containing protein [Jiangellales bacterium]|nr:STAS domain-containing protein [Jiangellales bacterium]